MIWLRHFGPYFSDIATDKADASRLPLSDNLAPSPVVAVTRPGVVLPANRECATMPKPAHQHDMSVLSACKQGMVFLTANDWALIADKARHVEFKPGDTIIHRGKRSDGLYLIIRGAASVQMPGQATAPTTGPGEVCGEISFLDEQPATLNVVAKDAVEAYHLDHATLQSLFELFPHLASRFYHSLASSLAGRLRELIGRAAGSNSSG
jgi:Cyclic nucleotide-binding domain